MSIKKIIERNAIYLTSDHDNISDIIDMIKSEVEIEAKELEGTLNFWEWNESVSEEERTEKMTQIKKEIEDLASAIITDEDVIETADRLEKGSGMVSASVILGIIEEIEDDEREGKL